MSHCKRRVYTVVLAFGLLLSGCASADAEPAGSAAASSPVQLEVADEIGGGTVCERSFGSYMVPEGWVKSEEHSTREKYFYVQDGHERDRQPDNIAVSSGTNRYSMEEHEQFRDAIMAQISGQISGQQGVMLQGSGTTSEQGLVEYVFAIQDAGVMTKQYYLVGDYRYCLVHLTNFHDSQEAEEAAKLIADSFAWAKQE